MTEDKITKEQLIENIVNWIWNALGSRTERLTKKEFEEQFPKFLEKDIDWFLESQIVRRTPEEIKVSIEKTVARMLKPWIPDASAKFELGEDFLEWLTAPKKKDGEK